jgi:hypothetical protein
MATFVFLRRRLLRSCSLREPLVTLELRWLKFSDRFFAAVVLIPAVDQTNVVYGQYPSVVARNNSIS